MLTIDDIRIDFYSGNESVSIGENVWSACSFTDDYLLPTKDFVIVSNHLETINNIKDKVKTGFKAVVWFGQQVKTIQYVREINISASKSKGYILTMSFRDVLGLLEDQSCSPKSRFTGTETIKEIIHKVINDSFGLPNKFEEIVIADSVANLNYITGKLNSKSFVDWKPTPIEREIDGKVISGYNVVDENFQETFIYEEAVDPIKVMVYDSHLDRPLSLKDMQPHENEGVYEFIIRILHRHSLHLRSGIASIGIESVSNPDQITNEVYEYLIVDEPRYNQNSIYNLNGSDIISFEQHTSIDSQMSAVFMFGSVNGSQEALKAPVKCCIVNPYTGIGDDGKILPEIEKQMKDLKITNAYIFTNYLRNFQKDFAKTVRIKYEFDKKCVTSEQLINAGITIMSKFLDKAYYIHAMVPGVTLHDNYTETPITVDTIVNVKNEDLNIDEPMWIEKQTVTISKDGSSSNIVLKRLYAMIFGYKKGMDKTKGKL